MKTIHLLLIGTSALLMSCATPVKTQSKSVGCCTSRGVSTTHIIKEGELFGTGEIVDIGGIKATYDEHLDVGRLVFARCHGNILVTLPCHDDLLPEKLPLPEFAGMSIEQARLSGSFLLSWFSVKEGGGTVRKTRVHPIHKA
jgi:hypothetical protein